MRPRVTLAAGDEPSAALVIPVAGGEVAAPYAACALACGFFETADAVCDILGGTRRVLLVRVAPLERGGGRSGEKSRGDWQGAGARAAYYALREPCLAIDLRGVGPGEGAAFIEGACLRSWRDELWRTRDEEDAPRLAALVAFGGEAGLAAAWARRAAAVEGAQFARDLVSEPANTLTPDGFVARLVRLSEAGVELTVLRGPELSEAGLSGLLAVGGGSSNMPALAVLRWPGLGAAVPGGSADAPPLAFVGKGITFDTGGICIKPADHMWEMRADMAGAAACAGAMLALARRGAQPPAMAVLALAENAISGSAYRPSDVLRHADGTTIEIIDTDAEGRLVLADALGWVVRQGAGGLGRAGVSGIVDLATLTGSVVTALGHERAGLFSNDDALAARVIAAGEAVGERVWRLPIDASHRAALESDIADLRQCATGRGQPDASQAAAFLRHFVGQTPWVHLDIAGVESRAEADGEHAAGATGFGVRLLDALVGE